MVKVHQVMGKDNELASELIANRLGELCNVPGLLVGAGVRVVVTVQVVVQWPGDGDGCG